MSNSDRNLSISSVKKQRLSSKLGLQLILRFPHLPAIILILFTVFVYAEVYFVLLTPIIQLGFVNRIELCQGKTTIYNKNYFYIVIIQRVVLFLLFPLAGWLADAKYGRLKVINMGLWLIWWSFLLLVLSLLVYNCWWNNQGLFSVGICLCIMSMIGITMGAAGVLPNILPFIIDQLTEASNSWVSSYVRWYAWAQFCGVFLGLLTALPYYAIHKFPPTISIMVLLYFGLQSLIVVANIFCKQIFTQSQANDDPYRTVFGVANFARKHKGPVMRSAATYCERDIPSRLDFAKTKYGGPYTYESVENVKTFFRILVVLLSMAGYYYVIAASSFDKSNYFYHFEKLTLVLDNVLQNVLFFNNLIIPILMIPFLELIVHRLWPKIEYYVHKPFIWITLGFVVLLVCNGYMTIVAGVTSIKSHNETTPYNCLLNKENHSIDSRMLLDLHSYFWIFEILSLIIAVSNLLVFTSTLYFIVCQAPSSMRGMLLGLFLLVHGFLASVSNLFSFLFSVEEFLLSCRIWYWGALTAIVCVSFPVFLIVAKKYKKRERQEIVNYRCMIESVIERDYKHREQHQLHLRSVSNPIVTSLSPPITCDQL